MPKEIRECKRDECGRPFSSYPSSNKRYCRPQCRYADPALAELLRPNIAGRHALTEIDPEALTGVCAVCGPVVVRRRIERRIHAQSDLWRCRTAERSRIWARQYGLSAQDVMRLFAQQGGLCAICPKPLEPRFNVDHHHGTGKVRGLLCSACNTGLGQFGDDPGRLRRAASYIESAA